MNWIKVNNPRLDMPIDGRPFISLWKGRISLTQFDLDEHRFYIMFDPAEYSQAWQIPQERENKFTDWMELPDYPQDFKDKA